MKEPQTDDVVRFPGEAGERLSSPGVARWPERLERRYDDCESALGWFLDSGAPTKADARQSR